MPRDPREQTAADAALIQHLIKTVVEPEVIEPMTAIGWSHGTPPPPRALPDNPEVTPEHQAPAPPVASPEARQPAPVVSPAAAPVAGEPKKDAPVGADPLAFLEEMKDPKTGLYGGKYKTREEFVKGVGHVVQMAKTAFSKTDVAEQEAARLRAENETLRRTPAAPAAAPMPAPVVAPQAAPISSAKLDKVLASLEAEGGILDKENLTNLVEGLREVLGAEAAQAAENRISAREAEKKAENDRWQAVDEHMQQAHPDSLAYSNEIGLYVRSTPLVAAAVGAMVKSGNLNEAAELSWEMFRMAHQGMSPTEVKAASAEATAKLEAGDQVRREAVDAARKDAGVASSAATGVHETPGVVGPSQEEIDQAAAEMRAGDGTRWRALTIGKTLTDPIFDQMERGSR